MQLVVNGVETESAARTIAELVREALGDRPLEGVAVAVAATVVRRADWATRSLAPGDRVEIIRAVGGG